MFPEDFDGGGITSFWWLGFWQGDGGLVGRWLVVYFDTYLDRGLLSRLRFRCLFISGHERSRKSEL